MLRRARTVLIGAAIGMSMAGCASTQTVGEQVDDDVVSARVEARLARAPDVKGRNIDVDTLNKIVTLRGQVDTARERETAERIARQTSDVNGVVNQLKVIGERPPAEVEDVPNDAWIHSKVTARLTSDPMVKKRNIDVDVERGLVTLSGIVESEQAKQRAEELARQTKGVEFVQNDLQVENP